MDKFDPHYYVKTREFKFPAYNQNKFIDGQVVYVLNDDYKYNII